MAHNIAIDHKGNAMVFVAGAPAWHKLGQNVKDAQTWLQAQKLAHLDFELADEPIRTDFEVIPGFKAIIRTDTNKAIGVVGKDFTTVQPSEAFQFVDTLIESGDAHYVSAGALGDGQKMWVLARVPSADIEVSTGDKTESYLMFAQGFDGSMSVISRTCKTRIVCNNTLTAALNEKGFSLKLRHTSSVNARLRDASKLVSGVVQDSKQLEDKLRLLATRRVTKETMETIFKRLFPVQDDGKVSPKTQNVLADIMGLYESNDRNMFPDVRGTAYNLLNAITEYTDHHRATRANGKGTDYHRAESAMFGSGAQLKQQALDVILTTADGMPIHRPVTFAVTAPTPKVITPGTSVLDAILG